MPGLQVVEIDVQMEDQYKIEIHSPSYVVVENKTVPDSCELDVYNCKRQNDRQEIYTAFNNQDWETFICKLIEMGYLN